MPTDVVEFLLGLYCPSSLLYVDTCVLLAVLMPEVHSAVAAAFFAEASAPLAISSWSVTELHSAFGVKVRTKALIQAQAEAPPSAAWTLCLWRRPNSWACRLNFWQQKEGQAGMKCCTAWVWACGGTDHLDFPRF